MIAAWAVAWRFLGARPGPADERTRPDATVRAPRKGDSHAGQDPLAVPRVPAVSSGEPSQAAPPPSGSADPGSPLAQSLARVTESFLTTDPRVAELLALSQDLAAGASVDPESVQVQRDEEGQLRFSRGTLLVGDLRGTFLIEEGVYVVRFSTPGEAQWGQRDLQLTFQDGLSQAAGCQATVQFHPRTDEPASRHVAPGEAKVVGWGLAISPETGSVAQPLVVGASGDAWQIEAGREQDALQLPWISGTASFDAWLRLLRPYAER